MLGGIVTTDHHGLETDLVVAACRVIMLGFRLRKIRVCMPEEAIRVKGARVNNLKNISFTVPINQMTVVTGVSGSGKSSLAFDTIYAEGQRRYVESLSAYARQFLERMDKPDVDEIHGIAPAIAIRQKNSTRNPRSTVGTQTEIYDYLRLLFARVGQTFCRVCGRLVTRDSPDSIAEEVLGELPEGTRFYVLFPASAGLSDANREASKKPRRGASSRQWLTAHLMSLMQRGFTRLFFNGQTIDLQSPDDYPRDDFENVFVLVDRLTSRADVRQRLVDSLEICFQEGHGTAFKRPIANPNDCGSPNTSNASTTTPFTQRRNLACSVSTTRTARVQRARVSETRSGWISIS
jgi:excinuclease ABC subunit A